MILTQRFSPIFQFRRSNYIYEINQITQDSDLNRDFLSPFNIVREFGIEDIKELSSVNQFYENFMSSNQSFAYLALHNL